MVLELIDRGGCPLCDSPHRHVHIDFPDIPIHRCDGCGFLYSSKVMSAESLRAYYVNDFGSIRHQRGQRVNAKVNVWAIQELVNLDSIKTLLDVGTGYGFFIKELRDRFALGVTGVELSAQEAAYAKEELKLEITNSALAESGLKKNYYDVVTSFEVIEHISRPRDFLSEVIEYVKPNGHLLLMTDNFECATVKALGPGFPKWIPHAHISHFSPGTLENLMTDAGLEIVGRLSYTPWELLARRYYYELRGLKIQPAEAFGLQRVMKTEMGGSFRLYPVRRLFNKMWAQLQAQANLNGALMYVLAKRVSRPIEPCQKREKTEAQPLPTERR